MAALDAGTTKFKSKVIPPSPTTKFIACSLKSIHQNISVSCKGHKKRNFLFLDDDDSLSRKFSTLSLADPVGRGSVSVNVFPRGRGRGGPFRGRRGVSPHRRSPSPRPPSPPVEEPRERDVETGNGSALFSSVETGTSYPSSPEFVSGIQTELQKLRQELEFNFKRQGADGQIEETDQSVQTLSKPIQGDPEVAALAEMVRLQERLQKAENRAEVARGQLLRVHWRLLELKKTLRRGNLPLGLRQLGTVLQASGSAVKELMVAEEEGITTGPSIVVEYVTSWNSAFFHFSTPSQGWTEVPGIPMEDAITSANLPLAVKTATINSESVEFVLTDGQGAWDKAPDGGNYQIQESGTYLLRDGGLIKLNS